MAKLFNGTEWVDAQELDPPAPQQAATTGSIPEVTTEATLKREPVAHTVTLAETVEASENAG